MNISTKALLGKLFSLILVIFCSLNSLRAQVKIGTNPEQIQSSSLLELESQTKGLLLPRLSDTLAINSLNPVDGMLIYLEKAPKNGLYVRQAGVWKFLSGVAVTTTPGGGSIDPGSLDLSQIGGKVDASTQIAGKIDAATQISGKIDPATQLSAPSTAVSGEVLTWNGSSWESKSILQVSTTIVEKAKEFNTSTGNNVIIDPNSTNVVTVEVTGAVPGDIVFVALIGDSPDFAVYSAWVSGTNEVSIRFANYQPEPVTIIGTQYKVLLMK